MIIPNSIEIQIKDSNFQNLNFENIICHLNIFIDNKSYFTYTFLPTNQHGKVILKKEQIIQNTEIKHFYDDKIAKTQTTKFEFFVIGNKLISSFINSLESYLNIDKKMIKEDLKRRGFSNSQISIELPKVIKQQEVDRKKYNFLKSNKNKDLSYSENKSKIKGEWKSTDDIKYELILKL